MVICERRGPVEISSVRKSIRTVAIQLTYWRPSWSDAWNFQLIQRQLNIARVESASVSRHQATDVS